MKNQFLILHPADNVATALDDVPAQAPVRTPEKDTGIVTAEPIPFEHKVALCDLATGSLVIKYGVPIGELYAPVRAGERIHLHNLKSRMIVEE